jgi:hypothetical protein
LDLSDRGSKWARDFEGACAASRVLHLTAGVDALRRNDFTDRTDRSHRSISSDRARTRG